MNHLTKKLILAIWLTFALSLSSLAQNPVILAPLPQLQFFDQSGRPLSFGCVFTYTSNTTTPLTTYTDYTGNTANANPVVLSAGGSANIWLQAGLAYAFRIKSSGGINCASGATLYTVNGVGGGVSILTTVVPFSANPTFTVGAQNQLFQITLTGNATSLPLAAAGILSPSTVIFQITQGAGGGYTFTWPANVIGGCTIGSAAAQVTTQEFVWNGVTATAIGPCVTGAGPSLSAGAISATGTISAPAFIGGTLAGSSLTVNGSQVATGFKGTAGTAIATAASGAYTNGDGLCANSTSDIADCGFAPIQFPVRIICSSGATITVDANTTSTQPMGACPFPSGALNTIGKTIRITASLSILPASGSITSVAYFGFGTTSALGTFVTEANQTASFTVWYYVSTITCVVTTAGSSGVLNCQGPQTGNPGGGTIFANNDVTANLTGVVYVGTGVSFASGSASNVGSQLLLTIEQLN